MQPPAQLLLTVTDTSPECTLSLGMVISWATDAPSADIGRDASCEVHIQDATISRRHARISREGAGFAMEAISRGNGTFVDGAIVPVGARRPLTASSRVQLGGALFKVQILQHTVQVVQPLQPGEGAIGQPAAGAAFVVSWDADSCSVEINGRLLILAPLPSKTLALLLERPGEVVHRWDLQDALGVNVNLAQTISQIRSALLDCIKQDILCIDDIRRWVQRHSVGADAAALEVLEARPLLRHFIASRRGHGYRICLSSEEVSTRQI